MTIERTDFDKVDESDLRSLIEARRPEGLTIDYKRDPYGNSDSEKKEALKDITSFANSAGGHLIIGMEEDAGIPINLPGMPAGDVDALINRLENMIRNGVEPRVVGIRMRGVGLQNGKAAVVIRIPRSWNPPHRVSSGSHNKFYVRNSGGVHEASVEELRVLFTRAADAQERIRALRNDRVRKIGHNEGQFRVSGDAKLIAHLIPLSAFGLQSQIDIGRAFEMREKFSPIGSICDPFTRRYNLDGVVVWEADASDSGREQCVAYTQIFRNGMIEAAVQLYFRDQVERKLLLANQMKSMMEAVFTYLDGLNSLEVPPPIVLLVTLHGAAGARLIVRYPERVPERVLAFPNLAFMDLPEVIIDAYGTNSDYARAVRPMMDALWNASGYPECTYYDESGNWNPPR